MSVTHTVRTADGGTKEFDSYHRAFAIKAHCTECMGWEGRPYDCTATLCPLYPFRGGVLSTRKGQDRPLKGVESTPGGVVTGFVPDCTLEGCNAENESI